VLWLKPSYEAVGLPKLNGVAINGDFCEPSRLGLIRAADVDPINYVAVRPDHIGAIFFHRTALSVIGLPPNLKRASRAVHLKNENGLTVLCRVPDVYIFSGRPQPRPHRLP
jgi:hypothetical protein